MSENLKAPQGELNDAFTGEVFTPRARNHYEENDGVPFAPEVPVNRPTIRQRIENLLNRGVDPLAMYMRQHQGEDTTYDMDVPDDPEAPLTASEENYIEMVAADLAEQAPLPDEGMPRPPQNNAPATSPVPLPAASGGEGGSSPPSEASGASGPLAAQPQRVVPTR